MANSLAQNEGLPLNLNFLFVRRCRDLLSSAPNRCCQRYFRLLLSIRSLLCGLSSLTPRNKRGRAAAPEARRSPRGSGTCRDSKGSVAAPVFRARRGGVGRRRPHRGRSHKGGQSLPAHEQQQLLQNSSVPLLGRLKRLAPVVPRRPGHNLRRSAHGGQAPHPPGAGAGRNGGGGGVGDGNRRPLAEDVFDVLRKKSNKNA